jgi:hypothetical protein
MSKFLPQGSGPLCLKHVPANPIIGQLLRSGSNERLQVITGVFSHMISALPGLNRGVSISPTQAQNRLANGWRIVELRSAGYVRHGFYTFPKRSVSTTYWLDPNNRIFVPASVAPPFRWVRVARRNISQPTA